MTGDVERKVHPACALLPAMTESEYRELVDDIREHGLRHPIIVDDDGLILDGRHRWRACQEADVPTRMTTFRGTEAEKVALIVSENLHRRHMARASGPWRWR